MAETTKKNSKKPSKLCFKTNFFIQMSQKNPVHLHKIYSIKLLAMLPPQ